MRRARRRPGGQFCPPERAGSASALNETSSEFGGALGIALLGALVTAIYRVDVARLMPAGVSGSSADVAERGIGAASAEADTIGGAPGAALLEAAQLAYTGAFQLTAAISAGLMAVAAVTAVAIFRRPPRPATA